MFFIFFPNQTQQPRTQTHHKNTKEKEKKKQIIISDSFIVEPELSHSFPMRTTLSVSRPKQYDHSKSWSTLTVSRLKQHDPQDKPQQNQARPKQHDPLNSSHDPNPSNPRRTNPLFESVRVNLNCVDLAQALRLHFLVKKSTTASVVKVDSLGSAKEIGFVSTTHLQSDPKPPNPLPPSLIKQERHQDRASLWLRRWLRWRLRWCNLDLLSLNHR